MVTSGKGGMSGEFITIPEQFEALAINSIDTKLMPLFLARKEEEEEGEGER